MAQYDEVLHLQLPQRIVTPDNWEAASGTDAVPRSQLAEQGLASCIVPLEQVEVAPKLHPHGYRGSIRHHRDGIMQLQYSVGEIPMKGVGRYTASGWPTEIILGSLYMRLCAVLLDCTIGIVGVPVYRYALKRRVLDLSGYEYVCTWGQLNIDALGYVRHYTLNSHLVMWQKLLQPANVPMRDHYCIVKSGADPVWVCHA